MSAFEITKTDAVVGDPVDLNLVIQAGEIRVRGLEAELSARPLDPWTIVASRAWSDSEITRDTNSFVVGNRLAGVPEHQAALWTSWAFEGALEGLTVGGGLFHASGQAATTSNNFDLPGYTRLDLNAAWAFGDGYAVRLNVDNVTDETIFITGGFFADLSAGAADGAADPVQGVVMRRRLGVTTTLAAMLAPPGVLFPIPATRGRWFGAGVRRRRRQCPDRRRAAVLQGRAARRPGPHSRRSGRTGSR